MMMVKDGGDRMAAKQNRNSSASEAEQLRRENKALKAELQKIKKSNSQPEKRFDWANFFKWASISLAGAIFIVASIVFYIGMTLTNTDRFMDVAEPLAKQPAVQEAVAIRTTNALFEKVDVESLSREALPDRVDFLAPTVATQIKAFTKNETQKLIATDTFQEAWNTKLRIAHQRFIERLKNYEGDGTIDINDVFRSLTDRIDNEKLSFLKDKSLPPRIGNITVVEAQWLPQAHAVVSNFQTVRVATITFFMLLMAFAVWVSKNRRKTLIELSWMIIILSFVMLLALRVAKRIFLDNADPQFLQASTEIWTVFTRPFIIQLITTMVIGLVILIICWLGSGSRSSMAVKRRVDSLFAGELHETIFRKENVITRWVGVHQKTLVSIVGVGFVLSLIIIDLNLASFISAAVVAILIILIILTLSGKK